MREKFLTFCQRHQPLLRDWRGCATTILLIAGLMTPLMSVAVQAQTITNFDFGSDSNVPRANCPVVAFYHPGGNANNYRVTTTVEGFVFDNAQEYSLQLASQSFSNPIITESTGFFHCIQQGNNPSMPYGDVAAKFPEFLGAGKCHRSASYSARLGILRGRSIHGELPFRRGTLRGISSCASWRSWCSNATPGADEVTFPSFQYPRSGNGAGVLEVDRMD